MDEKRERVQMRGTLVSTVRKYVLLRYTRNMIYKQHREIETSLSLVLCCLFSYSKISKRLEGVAYKLLLINHTACIESIDTTLKCARLLL